MLYSVTLETPPQSAGRFCPCGDLGKARSRTISAHRRRHVGFAFTLGEAFGGVTWKVFDSTMEITPWRLLAPDFCCIRKLHCAVLYLSGPQESHFVMATISTVSTLAPSAPNLPCRAWGTSATTGHRCSTRWIGQDPAYCSGTCCYNNTAHHSAGGADSCTAPTDSRSSYWPPPDLQRVSLGHSSVFGCCVKMRGKFWVHRTGVCRAASLALQFGGPKRVICRPYSAPLKSIACAGQR